MMTGLNGIRAVLLCLLAAAVPILIVAQQDQTSLTFDTPDFTLKLNKATQTIMELKPKGANGFDFAPSDRLADRAADGFNSIGDLNLRVRCGSSRAWENYSTSAARHPVDASPSG